MVVVEDEKRLLKRQASISGMAYETTALEVVIFGD